MSTNVESHSLMSSPKRESTRLEINKKFSPRIASQTKSPSNDCEVYKSDRISRPYLPECWSDSTRMTSLFAPFRAREANPEGFDLKMNFWSSVINKWSLQTHSVIFNVKDIQKAFERGSDSMPKTQCIQLVISHLVRNKSVMYLNEYKAKVNGSKNWVNWGFNTLVVKPFSIGWSLISGNKDEYMSEEIFGDINDETKFVYMQTLEVMSEELNIFLNQMDGISCIRFDNLFAKCKHKLNINFDAFEVLITNLELENKLKIIVDNGIRIVKIGNNVEIRELDIGLIRLETAKELLENEIQKLDDEIESLKEEARLSVKNRNREKAILILKKKKRIENNLNNKEIQLDNVDVLIDQLLNSNSHNFIIHAFQRAAEALKLANNSPDEIETTITDIEETIDVVNEVISDVSRPLVSIDNQDIDDELDQLLSEIEEKPPQDRQSLDEQISRLNNISINNVSLSDKDLLNPIPESPQKKANSLAV